MNRRSRQRAFTLIELLVSMTLLIMAITIALFAVIGTNGLIARTDARSSLAESARSIADELRRITANTKLEEVQILAASGQNIALQVKTYGGQEQQNICQVIGRAVATTTNGEEKYTLDATGPLLAEWIYRLNAANVCEQSPTDVVLYQGRLTNSQIVVKTFLLSANDVADPCKAECLTVKQIRFSLNVETTQTLSGTSAGSEAAHPSLGLIGSLPVGLNQ
jgi:type II secretory pathway pseudopilin PulG